MAYIITSDTLGLAIGPVAETADHVHEALRKARQMYETGLVNVSIKDEAGTISTVTNFWTVLGKRRSPTTFRQNRRLTSLQDIGFSRLCPISDIGSLVT